MDDDKKTGRAEVSSVEFLVFSLPFLSLQEGDRRYPELPQVGPNAGSLTELRNGRQHEAVGSMAATLSTATSSRVPSDQHVSNIGSSSSRRSPGSGSLAPVDGRPALPAVMSVNVTEDQDGHVDDKNVSPAAKTQRHDSVVLELNQEESENDGGEEAEA